MSCRPPSITIELKTTQLTTLCLVFKLISSKLADELSSLKKIKSGQPEILVKDSSLNRFFSDYMFNSYDLSYVELFKADFFVLSVIIMQIDDMTCGSVLLRKSIRETNKLGKYFTYQVNRTYIKDVLLDKAVQFPFIHLTFVHDTCFLFTSLLKKKSRQIMLHP